MESRGDHATHCTSGFGATHRHKKLRNELAKPAFRAAGLACSIEVPFLIPNTDHRSADILVQSAAPAPGMPLGKPTAYDVTVRSFYMKAIIRKAAQTPAAAAEAVYCDKQRAIKQTIRNALHFSTDAEIPCMDWHFEPLAFDTLGAASVRSIAVINGLAQNIATRSHSSYSIMNRLHQRISYAIWTVATAILARMPIHATDVVHPIGA